MLIIFFIFKARLLIFWVIGHVNDLVTWYDCHDDQARLSPVLGCGSLTLLATGYFSPGFQGGGGQILPTTLGSRDGPILKF